MKNNVFLLLARSRKVQVAVAAVVVTVLVRVFRLDEAIATQIARNVVTLAVVVIAGIAVEDSAQKLKGTKHEKDEKPFVRSDDDGPSVVT